LLSALSGDWYRNAAAYISPPRSRPISRFYRPTFVPDENLSVRKPLILEVVKCKAKQLNVAVLVSFNTEKYISIITFGFIIVGLTG
jgi:hypothetical protein